MAGSSNDMFQAFTAFLQQYRGEPSTTISCHVSQAAGEASSSQTFAEDCGERDDHPKNVATQSSDSSLYTAEDYLSTERGSAAKKKFHVSYNNRTKDGTGENPVPHTE